MSPPPRLPRGPGPTCLCSHRKRRPVLSCTFNTENKNGTTASHPLKKISGMGLFERQGSPISVRGERFRTGQQVTSPLERLQRREPEGAAAVGRGDPGEGEPSGRKGSAMLNLCVEGLRAPAPRYPSPKDAPMWPFRRKPGSVTVFSQNGSKTQTEGRLGELRTRGSQGFTHTAQRDLGSGTHQGRQKGRQPANWRAVSGQGKCPQQQQTFRPAER